MKKNLILAVAAASAFFVAPAFANTTEHMTHHHGKHLSKGQMVRCMGVTSCKGVKKCTEPCEGKASCKETGYVLTTKAVCDKVRGHHPKMIKHESHKVKVHHIHHATPVKHETMKQDMKKTQEKQQ